MAAPATMGDMVEVVIQVGSTGADAADGLVTTLQTIERAEEHVRRERGAHVAKGGALAAVLRLSCGGLLCNHFLGRDTQRVPNAHTAARTLMLDARCRSVGDAVPGGLPDG